MSKINLCVIFGGASSEHEVSLLSAASVLRNLDLTKYNVHKIGISKDGGWYYYTGIVNPGETTPNVFSHVEMVGSKINNSYIGKTLTLTVKAQAVQSENNPLSDGNIYSASGWPKEAE